MNTVEQIGDFWAMPCSVSNGGEVFPVVFREWKFGTYVVQSYNSEVIYKSTHLLWVSQIWVSRLNAKVDLQFVPFALLIKMITDPKLN